VPRIVPQKYPHPAASSIGGVGGSCSRGAEHLRRPLVIKAATELVNRQSHIKPHGVMPGRFFASARATLARALTPIYRCRCNSGCRV
jgi:hypothetical protein